MPNQLYTTQKWDDFGVKNLYQSSQYSSAIYKKDLRYNTNLYYASGKSVPNLYIKELVFNS